MPVAELSLSDLEASSGPTPCKVARILDKLTDQERSTVEQALAGDRKQYPHSKIATALSKRVWSVGDKAVAEHRSGVCCCNRGAQ